MNLGISNTHSTSWKRFKAQQIAAAASVGLAVVAAVGGLTLRDSNPAPSSPRAAAPASIARQAPLPETYVYIVGSQAEAAELTSGIANASEEAVDSTSRQVFVVDSPMAEHGLLTMHGELVLAGMAENVRFVDLRQGVPVPALSARPAGYVEAVTPEAELLSTGINPSWQTAPAGTDEYVELVTPEAEMLSTGMSLP